MLQSGPLSLVGDDLRKVEDAILTVASPHFPEVSGLMRSLLTSGGKRIRPALVLLTGSLNNYDLDRLIDGAVAAELLHTASLVHDDTIDKADTRRGSATLNSVLTDHMSVLIGDYVFAQSAIYAAKTRSTEVVAVFAQTLADICDGELDQLLTSRDARVSRDSYFRRIYAKTGSLFACATEIGAILSDAPSRHRALLRTYGERLGQAFQIVDDMMNLKSSPEALGKPVGSDLAQGIATLPTIIYLTELGSAQGHAVVRSALMGDPTADYAAATGLIVDSPAMDLAFDEARKLADEACASLLQLPASDARSALFDLAGYVLSRNR